MNDMSDKQAARLKYARRKHKPAKQNFRAQRSKPYERDDSWKKNLDKTED